VESIGTSVTEFKIGDEVVGLSSLDIGGGYAEYAVMKKYNLVKKPSLLSHEKAAAIVAAGIRAYTALHYQMRLTAGDSILICNGVSVHYTYSFFFCYFILSLSTRMMFESS
jgi:NADPH:quinone reductase-like Zn-dependent oxidoreductase